MASTIGLAVVAGIRTGRINAAGHSGTASAATAIEYGCPTDPGAKHLTPDYVFSVFCNTDMTDLNILEIVTPTFETCMDACASYRSFQTRNNQTCDGVSFVPAWVDRSVVGVPVSCYLKHGPLSEANLKHRGDITVHSAIVGSRPSG